MKTSSRSTQSWMCPGSRFLGLATLNLLDIGEVPDYEVFTIRSSCITRKPVVS
jgi:hypothetical protein